MTTHSPIAAYHRTLRKDPRGWQIDDDDAAEYTLQCLEILGLIFAEMTLHRLSHLGLDTDDPDLDLSIRALGSISGRVAMSRLSWLTGVDETGAARNDRAGHPDAETAGLHMRTILAWLLEWDLTNPDAPPELRKPTPPPASVRVALSELWAAAMYLDRRASQQGTSGPGERRNMIRTTSRRVHGR